MSVQPGSGRFEAGGPESVDIQDVLHLLMERWWLFLLFPALCLGGGYFFLKTATPLYSSAALVEVRGNTAAAGLPGVASERIASEDIRTFERAMVAYNVLEALAATEAPGVEGLGREQEIKKLRKMFRVENIRSTRLFSVLCTHASPEDAARLANGLIQAFLAVERGRQVGEYEQTETFLRREADRLRAELEKSEQALQAFKRTHQTTDVEGGGSGIASARLQELGQTETEARARRLKIEADLRQLETLLQGGSVPDLLDRLLTVPSVAEDPTVQNLRGQVTSQEADIAVLGERYRSKHPRMMEAQGRLKESKANLVAAVARMPEVLMRALESARGVESTLEKAVQDQEQTKIGVEDQAIRYRMLEREAQANRTLYEQVLERLKQATVAASAEPSSIRVVEDARKPSSPSFPDSRVILGASALLGLVLAVASIGFAEVVFRTVKTVDEAENLLGLPVLGAIPDSGRRQADTALDPGSPAAEGFRTLRASLFLGEHGAPRRLVMVTSAVPKEGKTFCSCNLALALALVDGHTLLVDADMRHPSVMGYFGLPDERPGFAELLAGQAPEEAWFVPGPVEGLWILGAGRARKLPAELLSKRAAVEWACKTLAGAFQRVILDTAPVNVVGDSLFLAQSVDATLLVVRSRSTPPRAARFASSLLARSGKPVTGVVLNRLPQRPGHQYYYHYAHHHGYGEDPGNLAAPRSHVRN